MLEAAVGILGTALIGALAWIFRLGNRVTKLEVMLDPDGLPALIKAQFGDMARRLERLENLMDSFLKGH